MSDFGLDTVSPASPGAQAGAVQEHYLLLDSAATAAVGQVVQYDSAAHNWVDFTAYSASGKYAVCNEAKTLSVDTACRCIIAGPVYLSLLDATAQADADIEAGLISNGIIPVSDGVV